MVEDRKDPQPTVVDLVVAVFHSIVKAAVRQVKEIQVAHHRDRQDQVVVVQEPQVPVLRARPVEQVERATVHLSQDLRHFTQQEAVAVLTAAEASVLVDPA